jgi:hypothetical protein
MTAAGIFEGISPDLKMSPIDPSFDPALVIEVEAPGSIFR